VLSELRVGLVVIAPNGGFLEDAVHPLDLTVGPGMVRLGEAVLDTMLAAVASNSIFGFDRLQMHPTPRERVRGRAAMLHAVSMPPIVRGDRLAGGNSQVRL
jgi:hypothetical protein